MIKNECLKYIGMKLIVYFFTLITENFSHFSSANIFYYWFYLDFFHLGSYRDAECKNVKDLNKFGINLKFYLDQLEFNTK